MCKHGPIVARTKSIEAIAWYWKEKKGRAEQIKEELSRRISKLISKKVTPSRRQIVREVIEKSLELQRIVEKYGMPEVKVSKYSHFDLKNKLLGLKKRADICFIMNMGIIWIGFWERRIIIL